MVFVIEGGNYYQFIDRKLFWTKLRSRCGRHNHIDFWVLSKHCLKLNG